MLVIRNWYPEINECVDGQIGGVKDRMQPEKEVASLCESEWKNTDRFTVSREP